MTIISSIPTSNIHGIVVTHLPVSVVGIVVMQEMEPIYSKWFLNLLCL